jgi:hypothetical protein
VYIVTPPGLGKISFLVLDDLYKVVLNYRVPLLIYTEYNGSILRRIKIPPRKTGNRP